MKNFQTKLDVIGNNIANVNTYGFKKGRVSFNDMVSQTVSGASGGNANRGGVNPKQVGLGSQLAAIDTIDTQGSMQTTGRVLDVGIQGDGYLIVKNGEGAPENYTRAGVLYFDNAGNLVTASGHLVCDDKGNSINVGNPNDISNINIDEYGKITYLVNTVDENGDTTTTEKTAQIGIARFNNNGGLEKIGENLYINTAASGNAKRMTPNSGGAGKLVSGALEMSNVDLSEEFTEMIVAQRGFQANTRIITTSDEILQELVNLKR